MYGKGIGAYQQTSIMTADPLKLVIMCYEGAISHLKVAREAYEEKDFETKAKSLQRVLDIIHELSSALDFEKGGAVAANLSALYAYMTRRILEGDLKRDMKAFDEVAGMLEELHAAWKEIFYGPKKDVEGLPQAIPQVPQQHVPAAAGWRG